MEENNQNEENKTCELNDENKHVCFKNHCWKMCLGMVLAAFLGGFLATYFVADQMANKKFQQNYHELNPRFDRQMFDDIDREMKQEMKHFNKMMKSPDIYKFVQDDIAMQSIVFPEPVKIESELENGNFNVEVGLKPFQDDESKINYNIAGKKLTVFGESKVKDGKTEQDISFSHDFILPENADTMNIQKVKKGHKLIISVPLKI